MHIEEVFQLDQVPQAPEGKRYFVCIGGSKNYCCFLADKSLSRAAFMDCYAEEIPFFLRTMYEDKSIQVRLDSTYAVPGFCIISPRGNYRTVTELPQHIYIDCVHMAANITRILYRMSDVELVYFYYDEHYVKPASAHFWVLPIYASHLKDGKIPEIADMSVWHYMETFDYQTEAKRIQTFFFQIQEELKRYGV